MTLTQAGLFILFRHFLSTRWHCFPFEPSDFTVAPNVTAVNFFLFLSIELVPIDALLTVLFKSWLRDFDRGRRELNVADLCGRGRESRDSRRGKWAHMSRPFQPSAKRLWPFLASVFSSSYFRFTFQQAISLFSAPLLESLSISPQLGYLYRILIPRSPPQFLPWSWPAILLIQRVNS